MVLLGRIELPTSALPRMRSTTELQQHTIPQPLPGLRPAADRGALLAVGGTFVNPGLEQPASCRQHAAMCEHPSDKPPAILRPAPSREERLAAKLRENLRRRKAQARGLAGETADDLDALPKPPGKS